MCTENTQLKGQHLPPGRSVFSSSVLSSYDMRQGEGKL